MGQLLLLPDARPLDQRLGRRFFQEAPRRPGVYLMKDASGKVLYVGKAKDLKQRLNAYRVASPERMPRRHLRLVREVREIELRFCPNETAALANEAKLLRTLKPKYNRAGVWPGRPRFVAWQAGQAHLELALVETPGAGWRRFGPVNGSGWPLPGTLARLLWLALHPDRAATELPAGWVPGVILERAQIPCGTALEQVVALLEGYFWDAPDALATWLGERFATRTTRFERVWIATELESLTAFAEKHCQPAPHRQQMTLL